MPGKIVSRDEWLQQRKDLLAQEKATLRANDVLNSKLRGFPMVEIEKEYTFDGPDGKVKLGDLFENRKQLIVYHFMLGPEDKEGCTGCSFLADNFPQTSHLNSRDTTIALVSRAPLPNIQDFKARMGWTYPWYSSFGTEFNYDFNATLDEAVTPLSYNYKNKEEQADTKNAIMKGEAPGLSVFFKNGDSIYHTYSTYARGLERFLVTYDLLDVTPLGRQETNGMDWKLHDKY